MSNMSSEQFMEAINQWQEVAIKLTIAHRLFNETKHDLEIAKGTAWADGQVTGANADARKAALYIITEPYKRDLIEAEDAVVQLTTQEFYWRSIVEFSVWHGIANPTAFQGIKHIVDPFAAKEK